MIIQIIEITEGQITSARFRKKGEQLLPVSGLRLEWPDGTSISQVLDGTLPPADQGVRTILSIPPRLLTLRSLQLPIEDRKKLRSVLPLELAADSLDDSLPLVADGITISPGCQLAGWIRLQPLQDLLAELQKVGLDPEVITCGPLCWQNLSGELTGSTVFLRHDAMVVAEEGGLQFCRMMDTSDSQLLERTLSTLKVSDSISPVNRYWLDRPQNVAEKGAPLPTELTTLEGSGDLPPAALLSPLAMARGYLKGDIFNLRSGSLAWKGGHSQLLRQYRWPLLLAVVTLLLLFGELGLRWYLLQQDLNSINRSVAEIYKGIFPGRGKAVDEVGEVKSEIRRLESGGKGVELLRFMQLLAESKGDQLNGLSELEYDGEHFRLKGDAASQKGVTELQQRLAAASFETESPEISSRNDGSILFTIRGSSKGGGR